MENKIEWAMPYTKFSHNEYATGISLGRETPDGVDFLLLNNPQSAGTVKSKKLFPGIHLIKFRKPKEGKVVIGYLKFNDYGYIWNKHTKPISTWKKPLYSKSVVDPNHEYTTLFIGTIKRTQNTKDISDLTE